ncbi:hypothetical protein FRB96_002183 [Tulasnella sp. 330]|nr:hypothetical protein FRB96_002183 [Tulasnella sp. 330]KAG8873509.1 hypothetical protein FRB97_006668 [Tulasnella sp. 331]
MEICVDSRVIAAQTIGQLCRFKSIIINADDEDDVSAIASKIVELPALESLWIERLVGFPSLWPQSTINPFSKLKKLQVNSRSHPGTEAFLHKLASTGSILKGLLFGGDNLGHTTDLKEIMKLAVEYK